MISFGNEIATDLRGSMTREWLETNGIGGFASGTIAGANTRRYHGLLTASTRRPLGRLTLLSKLEETLVLGERRFGLSTNQFRAKVHPDGYMYLKGFRLDPFPIWTYTVEDVELEKRVFTPHGLNAVVCRWSITSEKPKARFELRPLIAFVDYHHLQKVNDVFDETYSSSDGVISVRPYHEMPKLFFGHNSNLVERTGFWYRDFQYDIERERGFDFHEDLFQPFSLSFDLGKPAVVVASTEQVKAADAGKLERNEIKRRAGLIKLAKAKTELQEQLTLAADQFIVARGEGQSVIAGYPWFSDWGRDTMISLPGLTLATGRPDVARSILLEFSNHISEGMLPNRFPDAGEEPEYNTADATLWYFEAIRAYAEATGDYDVIQDELYEKLAGILASHLRGTRYGIHVDTDGLLYAGEPGVQLTWMDAKIGGIVITPRTGKPVEIQALWYNALRIMEGFAERFGHDEDRERFDAMADLAKLSFNALFWNETEGCLFDVVTNGHRDASIRPNQIFAVSLAHPVLDEARWRPVVEKVRSELLTPVGLRSLSPRDPAYVPAYTGSPFKRDSAYHQGTVWGWLIGPYIDAYRKVFSEEEPAVAEMLSGLEQHLKEAGLGQISEIFDADPPHTPRGCPAQAWSVAEVLRVLRLH
jgi:predicted glycogen debranching enzyme